MNRTLLSLLALLSALPAFAQAPPRHGAETRYLNPHFCPYVRKDSKQPLFAPINDAWWRQINRWAQISGNVQFRDYYISVWFRPLADVWQHDFKALTGIGVRQFCGEALSGDSAFPEQWCMLRTAWEPDQDVEQLRKYYCRRTYREAAPFMERFFGTLRVLQNAEKRAVEFEECHETPYLLLKTRAANGPGTMAQELTALLEEARKAVRHPAAREYVEGVYRDWQEYMKEAASKVARKAG